MRYCIRRGGILFVPTAPPGARPGSRVGSRRGPVLACSSALPSYLLASLREMLTPPGKRLPY